MNDGIVKLYQKSQKEYDSKYHLINDVLSISNTSIINFKNALNPLHFPKNL